jgi:hypothetical protein
MPIVTGLFLSITRYESGGERLILHLTKGNCRLLCFKTHG